MPELPDVEGFRRYFNRFAAGQRVKRVELLDSSVLRNASPGRFARVLRGRRLERAERRGKWLLAPAGGPVLLLHFGMTGLLVWSGDSERHRHDRVVLQLDRGELAYRNMRKLGGVWIASDPEDARELLRPLGRMRRTSVATNSLQSWATVAGRTACWCPRCQPRGR